MPDYEWDYSKLRGRMVEVFGSVAGFCRATNSSPQSVSAKLNGKINITRSDIVYWGESLIIPQSEIGYYFFARKVKQS